MIEEDQWIGILKALADKSRLRIVRTLLEQALTVNDLSERLGISQYNVSKHLRILREAGLVGATKMANRREYAIANQYRGGAKYNLDLGCCLFRFDQMAPEPEHAAAAVA